MATRDVAKGREGPPLQIFQQSHPSDRRLSQKCGGIFLTTEKMDRTVNHGMNFSELRRKTNLLNKWKFFLPFSKTPLASPVYQAGKRGIWKCIHMAPFKGVCIISNSQRKTGYFNPNSHVETHLTLVHIFTSYAKDNKLIECSICDHGL